MNIHWHNGMVLSAQAFIIDDQIKKANSNCNTLLATDLIEKDIFISLEYDESALTYNRFVINNLTLLSKTGEVITHENLKRCNPVDCFSYNLSLLDTKEENISLYLHLTKKQSLLHDTEQLEINGYQLLLDIKPTHNELLGIKLAHFRYNPNSLKWEIQQNYIPPVFYLDNLFMSPTRYAMQKLLESVQNFISKELSALAITESTTITMLNFIKQTCFYLSYELQKLQLRQMRIRICDIYEQFYRLYVQISFIKGIEKPKKLYLDFNDYYMSFQNLFDAIAEIFSLKLNHKSFINSELTNIANTYQFALDERAQLARDVFLIIKRKDLSKTLVQDDLYLASKSRLVHMKNLAVSGIALTHYKGSLNEQQVDLSVCQVFKLELNHNEWQHSINEKSLWVEVNPAFDDCILYLYLDLAQAYVEMA
ncbi:MULTISPECIES: type VI secretion system baseplate subunit TssK [Cysteiniphilum]|uniref:Uncharacterized protein n=1 Tax=Cysteiniphilum litorale TaxID=2056700 RepID=A0A8J2Z5M8_9GAMM|nr:MULTISPECIES: type VI secretion system baseplate subunit TssK [Cysteiniphilum]GGG02795.1 hypothetical protein GCM10010995_20250 [Cysteiniphilum litorale]